MQAYVENSENINEYRKDTPFGLLFKLDVNEYMVMYKFLFKLGFKNKKKKTIQDKKIFYLVVESGKRFDITNELRIRFSEECFEEKKFITYLINIPNLSLYDVPDNIDLDSFLFAKLL